MVVKLHHVEFVCNNIHKRLRQFCGAFGFKPFAEASQPQRIALKKNSIYFVLTEDFTPRDTVSNITLEVKNVEQTTSQVQDNGGKVLCSSRKSTDFYGQTISSVIHSPCGNLLHTLLDRTNYSGLFLPGFQPITTSTLNTLGLSNLENECDNLITHVDHISFACKEGTSLQIIDWYKKCLGFKRFQVNADERDDGFTVASLVNGSFVGMKLSALEYWKCSEVGIETSSDDSDNNVKFVLGEPLAGQDGPNQIQTFLDEHGGPGVQHIGLHSNDMVCAVERWRNNGVEFVMPPDSYYTQPSKLQEILHSGQKAESLQREGILLDAESFTCKEDNTTKYLMQVFTKALFEENTFFMEIIQRFGAQGFGAGNITALWKALDLQLRKTQNKTKVP